MIELDQLLNTLTENQWPSQARMDRFLLWADDVMNVQDMETLNVFCATGKGGGVDATCKRGESHAERIRRGDGSGSRGDVVWVKGSGRGMAGKTEKSSAAKAGRKGSRQGRSAGAEAPENPELNRINDRLDRYQKVFEAKGNLQAAEWMRLLKEHINNVGPEAALAALGAAKGGQPAGFADVGKVQYEGAYHEMGETQQENAFIKSYLDKAGINIIHNNTPVDPNLPLVSSWSEKNLKAEGRPERSREGGNYIPTDQTFANKLEESKHLPGLETSEDVHKVLGEKMTNFTPEAVAKFDQQYGKGQWIVKSYGAEAFAGYGVYFPQRAKQIQQDAKAVIADARSNLKDKGYGVVRDEKGGEIVGLSKGNRAILFGGKDFDGLPKSVQTLGRQVRQAAPNEHGARLPMSPEESLQNNYGINFRRDKDGTPIGVTNWDGKEHDFKPEVVKELRENKWEGNEEHGWGGKRLDKLGEQDGGALGHELHRALEADQWRRKSDAALEKYGPNSVEYKEAKFENDPKFMVQPAFKAVGVSEFDRAMGATWETAKEGRVHVVTDPKTGKASAVPYATLVGRGDDIPAVFASADSRAMEKAVEDAINQLPKSERTGQMYAPDVVKTKDGWKVLELNASAEGGGSDWLGRNPFVIDAVASYMTGREPMHARFIRELLAGKGIKSQPGPTQPIVEPSQPLAGLPAAVKGGRNLSQKELEARGISREDAKAEGLISGGKKGKSTTNRLDEFLLLAERTMNSEDQPRQPAGSPEGGRFMGASSVGGVKTVQHGSLKVRYSEHTTKRIDGPNIPLPNLKQKDDHSCSFVAALTVAKHFDKNADPKDVLKAIRPTKSGGMDGKGVRSGLKQLGIDAEYKGNLTIGQLRKHVDEGTPVMLTVFPKDWVSDHWTVVQGFSGKGSDARIHLSNHKSMTIKQFKDEWFDKGQGLICKKRGQTANANPEGCNQHTGPGCNIGSSHADVKAAKTGNKDAVEKVLGQNIKMIHKIANKYDGGDKDLHDDLVQEGNLGILRAIDRFDPEKKSKLTGQPVQFSTVAWQWIKHKIDRAAEKHRETGGMEKGILSGPKGEEGERFFEPAAPKEKESRSDEMQEAMKHLNVKERDVVERYFGYNGKDAQSHKEIAAVHGVTPARINQIKEVALRKMRKHLTENSWHKLMEQTLNLMVLNAAVDGVFSWLPEMLTGA